MQNRFQFLFSPCSYWSELAGSGAVVTTADDMAKWLMFHLSEGRTPDGGVLMPSKTLQELYVARTAQQSPTTSKFSRPQLPVTLSYDVYGMGFRTGYYRGRLVRS
jgi:CubicO group peptidase (beta-lactamase class C family)